MTRPFEGRCDWLSDLTRISGNLKERVGLDDSDLLMVLVVVEELVERFQ